MKTQHPPFDGTDRELARRGGRASGAARRAKRDIRSTLHALLDDKVKDFTSGKKITRLEMACLALVKRACGGDVRAFCALRDTLEGRPTQRVEVADNTAEPLDVQVTFVSAKDGRTLEEHSAEELTEMGKIAFRGTPEEQQRLMSEWRAVEKH